MPDLAQRYFPIWKLGYRSNPFRALTLDEWRHIALLPKELEQLVESPPPLTQLIGHKGTGKTSTLLGLQEAFRERSIPASYEYIPAGKDNFDMGAVDTRIILLDEAQRLSSHARKRLLSLHTSTGSPGHIFLSTHEDLGMVAAQLNMPILTVALDYKDREFLESMIDRRLLFFQKTGHQGIRPTRAALDHAITVCGSDLRKLESLLYESFQTWDRQDAISKAHIMAMLNRMD